MTNNIDVELKADLSSYVSSLIPGIRGRTCSGSGKLGVNNDCFTGVMFNNGVFLDVAWRSLEIVDQEYLKKMEEFKQKEYEKYERATRVLKLTGPKGGFKFLKVFYLYENMQEKETSTASREEASEILEYFQNKNFPIVTALYENYRYRYF